MSSLKLHVLHYYYYTTATTITLLLQLLKISLLAITTTTYYCSCYMSTENMNKFHERKNGFVKTFFIIKLFLFSES